MLPVLFRRRRSGLLVPVGGGGGMLFPALPFALPIGLTHDRENDLILGTPITTPYVEPTNFTALTDTGDPAQNMANLQASVNAVSRNTKIVIPANWVGEGTLVLPEKSGTGWVVLEVAGYALPSGPPTSATGMFTLRCTSASQNALRTVNSGVTTTTHGRYAFRGMHVDLKSSVSTSAASPCTALVVLGDAVNQNALGKVPDGFYFEGCLIEGNDPSVPEPNQKHVRRGIEAHCANLHLYRTRIREIHSVSTTGNTRGDTHNFGSDSHCLWGWNGPGPWFVDQCTMEGGDECIGAGGATPLFGVRVSDVFVRHSRFVKPDAYRTTTFWRVKNHWETKDAERWLFHGCVFEQLWEVDNNQQHAFVLKADSHGAAVANDLQVHNCLVMDTPGLLLVARKPIANQLNGVALVNVLAKRLSVSPYVGANTRVVMYYGDGPNQNVYLDHVTAVTTASPSNAAIGMFSESTPGTLTLKNSLLDACGTVPTGVGGVWSGLGQGNVVLAANCTSHSLSRVRFIRASSSGPWPNYPDECQGYTSYGAVGFVDHANEHYALAPGAEGKNNADDGWDIGIADWDNFQARLALTPTS